MVEGQWCVLRLLLTYHKSCCAYVDYRARHRRQTTELDGPPQASLVSSFHPEASLNTTTDFLVDEGRETLVNHVQGGDKTIVHVQQKERRNIYGDMKGKDCERETSERGMNRK